MIPMIGFRYSLTGRAEARWIAMLALAFLSLVTLAPRAFPADLNDARMLDVIAVKEDFRGKPGAAGELDRWQMMPATVADRGGHDAAAAMRHLVWIKTQLQRAGVDVIPFNVALVWNAGLTRVLQGRALPRHYRYALDVVALYNLPAGRSALGSVGVRAPASGTSLAGNQLSRAGCLEWAGIKIGVCGAENRPDADPAAIQFVPVLHTASAASLTEHYEIAALCSGAGVSPVVPGGVSLQMHESPGAITCEVARAVERRTGWPCRDKGLPLVPAPLTEGSALPAADFRATVAMHRWQRAPLVEAVCATISI